MSTFGDLRGFLIGYGILMTLLGTIAILLPGVTTIAVEIIIGFVILFAGIAQTVTAFMERHEDGFWWNLLGGVIGFIGGILLLVYPIEGAITLTAIVSILIFAGGVFNIVFALQQRGRPNWGWLMLNGILGIVLANLIWWGFPTASLWFIGLLVGINILFSGISALAFAWRLEQATN